MMSRGSYYLVYLTIFIFSLSTTGYFQQLKKHAFNVPHHDPSFYALKATTSLHNKEQSLENEINALRASKIKSILKENNINTMGEFEKKGLAEILLQHEKKYLHDARITSVPLVNITSFTSTDKSYIGVELQTSGQSGKNDGMLFMLDTGATINLIRPDVATKLKAKTKSLSGSTSVLGGQGSIATSVASIDDICMGNRQFSEHAPCEFSVLSNSNMLPPKACGLLGLSFLKSIANVDEVTELDFEANSLRVGPRSSILTPLKTSKSCAARTFHLPNGLLVANCEVDNGQATAMIDIGSSYTIANTIAVEKLLKQEFVKLPLSSRILAGIDGQPIQMRHVSMKDFRLGGYHIDDPLDIVAGDIPGLASVGLGTQPAFILGMDILARHGKLILDLEKQQIFLSSTRSKD